MRKKEGYGIFTSSAAPPAACLGQKWHSRETRHFVSDSGSAVPGD